MIRIYERTVMTEYRLPSISTDSTGGGPLDVISDPNAQKVHSGILRNVAVSCDSTDFDFTLSVKRDSTSDGIDEIFKFTGGNLRVSYDDLHQGWINNDNPRGQNLYAMIVNNDLQHATGFVRIRLMNDINKRYSGRN